MRSRRKNFKEKPKNYVLPNIICSVLLAAFLVFIVYFIDPKTFLIIPVFLMVFFFAVYFGLGILIRKVRRKIIIAASITIFLILRLLKMGNFINFFLLGAITITILIYEYNSQKTN